jgi:hypothetical protein
MKNDLWFGVALWSVAAIVGAIAFPDLLAPIASAWTLIVLGRLMFELEDSAHALTQHRSEFENALRERRRNIVRPPDLVRLESGLGWGVYEPREFDHHVRPLLRQLIDHRSRGATIDPELEALAGTTHAEDLYGEKIVTSDLDRITRKIECL